MTKDSYLKLLKACVDHLRNRHYLNMTPRKNQQRILVSFCEKIDKIRDNFGTSKGFDKYDMSDFVIPKLSQFTPVSVKEIQKTVLKSPSKSCILDPIPTSLLKEYKFELMSIITKIVNLPIETGEMPSDFKHAVITPLPKRRVQSLFAKNCCPVSGLPFLSKAIEKVISQQLTQHVTASNLN